MDGWLAKNYRTVILVLLVLLGWGLFDRLVPKRIRQDRALSALPKNELTSRNALTSPNQGSGWSRSSTGKRHNSACRYYNSSKP